MSRWGPWHDRPPHGPPRKTGPSRAVLPTQEADGGIAHEVDADSLEHVRREALRQPAGRTALGGLNQTKIFLESFFYFGLDMAGIGGILASVERSGDGPRAAANLREEFGGGAKWLGFLAQRMARAPEAAAAPLTPEPPAHRHAESNFLSVFPVSLLLRR